MQATSPTESSPHSDGRLHARPALRRAAPQPPLEPGTHRLVFDDGRKALLHAPPNQDNHPLPLLMMLHGAGGRHGGADNIALAYAMLRGCLLLIPDALSTSWDMLRGGFGPDLAFLDRVLAWTMQRYDVAPHAVAIGGFSDGASYALSVGLMNGDLFSDILAFSPGFMAPLRRVGQPRIFVAHGMSDQVLPVGLGRGIARRLSDEAYQVRYLEFDGAHIVLPAVAAEGLRHLPPR